jgi:hypothetical protein
MRDEPEAGVGVQGKGAAFEPPSPGSIPVEIRGSRARLAVGYRCRLRYFASSSFLAFCMR